MKEEIESLIDTTVKVNIFVLAPVNSKEVVFKIKQIIKEHLTKAYSGSRFLLDITVNKQPLSIFYISRHAIRGRTMKEIYIRDKFNINETNKREIRYITSKSDWNRYLSRDSLTTIQSLCEEDNSWSTWFKNFGRLTWYYIDNADIRLSFTKEKSDK